MSIMFTVEFPLHCGKQGDLLALLEEALPDTRAFDGCIYVEAYAEQDGSSILLVEQWESKAHFEAYVEWRESTGFGDVLAPFLAANEIVRTYEIRSE